YKINSIAIPPLGAGNGGLEWEKVKRIIGHKLGHLDIDVLVYEPTAQIKERAVHIGTQCNAVANAIIMAYTEWHNRPAATKLWPCRDTKRMPVNAQVLW
ncbi:hypothetical protein JHJ32_22365, partial [Parapedobacter sp. ISTM3]|nr:hypothetical protein [Parapedobacter sp. ISTM3]